MRAPIFLIASTVLFVSPAFAAEEAEQVPAIFPVLDLVFTVEDLGWTIEDLRLQETETDITIALSADVLFDFDKADLRPEAKSALERVGDVIRERAKGTVRIAGHTDGKGLVPYNQALSERRAASVRDRLQKAAPGKNYVTVGLGASQPIAPNAHPDGSDDPAGRAKNRRVEIVIEK